MISLSYRQLDSLLELNNEILAHQPCDVPGCLAMSYIWIDGQKCAAHTKNQDELYKLFQIQKFDINYID